MKNQVTHKNIIKGILKEALFLDLEGEIEIGKSTLHGRIVELSDNEDEAMMLYLDLDETLPNDLPANVKISIFFKNFMARFDANIAFWRTPFVMIKFPTSVTLSNDRTEARYHLSEDVSTWTRVAIDNGECHAIAQFRPTNLSQNGLGGELVFPQNFELHPNTKISGDHWFNGQWVKLQGLVRSLRQLTSLHDGTNFCIIGIENARPYSKDKPIEHRARAERSNSKLEVEFSFIAQASKTFRLQIVNVSVSGFLVEINDVDVQNIALTSKRANRSRSTMQAQLVSFDGNQFRFQWIAGEESDRLKWLKEISTFIGPNIDPQGLRKDDILSLFCQSGALSDSYIKDQKALSKELLRSLEKASLQEPWIFRWTNRGDSGKAKGYVSAIKSGDNTWSIIDIVSDRYGEKLSKGFLDNFFIALADFSLTLTPCPLHFIGWVHGHPFFAKFQDFLASDGKQSVLAKCEMLYTRLKKEVIPGTSTQFKTHKIEASDYQNIERLQAQLLRFRLKGFTDTMDFTANTFGSPALKGMLQSHQHPFKREFWEFKNDQAHFFCVFTLIPEGQNPGRWVDSIFVFDLNDKLVSESMWASFKNELIVLAASLGYSTHAIRRMVAEGKQEVYAGEVAHLSAFVLHPTAWTFYRFKKTA